MRMNFTLAIAAMSLVAFTSCSKSAQEETVLTTNEPSLASQVVDVALETNGIYELPITASMGEVKVHSQAEHFELSEVGMDSKNSLKVYKYVPVKNYTGSDQVTLSQTKSYGTHGDGGECHSGNIRGQQKMNSSTTYLTIKFKVSPKS